MMKLLNMKMRLLVVAVATAPGLVAATPTISGVTAQQRYPWNGKVDISYAVTGDIAAEAKQKALLTSLKVSATDNIANETYTATKLSGDLALTAGAHKLVWDLDAEGLSFKSSDVIFKVSCETAPATYCMIDLSAGANASSYPVTYLASPPSGGFNVDEYKTSKLVMRRIEAGSFKMCGQYNVTLTKPFFCGIFEMTQRQWELVTGNNPCSSTSYGKGNNFPLHYVSYDMIRGASEGAKWPSSSCVDSSSFLGKLQSRSGLSIDLPTEAQWEYACRAGTTTTFSYGGSANGNYMWYESNSDSSAHVVGTKSPNLWGRYDRHGNVWELCLDWYDSSLSSGVTDPKGPSSGHNREMRGGDWRINSGGCTSSYRPQGFASSDVGASTGFRLFRTLPSADTVGSLCSGVSVAMKIDTISGVRTTAATEEILYSTSWVDGTVADAKAVVTVNGETMKSAMGSGYVEWSPRRNGTYTLEHKVMSGDAQIGDTLSAIFSCELYMVETPIIAASEAVFDNVSQEISISCETDGATILFTTDGSDPAVNGREYKRPFDIYQSCTVRAVAVKYDWKNSAETTATFTRADSLSEAANLYGYTMETDETHPWTVVTDISHDGVSSVRSGAIGNGGTTYLQASVRKAGTVSFWWKAMCENVEVEDGETYYYDFGSFSVDGVVMARIAGHDTGWQFVSVDVAGGGKHTLRWEYSKDGATSYAPDCVWLDQVQWAPADGSGFTMTSPEPVPYSWLSTYGFGGIVADFETAAKAPSGKRDGGGKVLSVWQDYVAGTDPTNVTSRFTAKIEMCDGEPIVTWEPDLNENGTKSERLYKVYGSETLDGGGEWQYPTNSLHRFFKVTVEIP